MSEPTSNESGQQPIAVDEQQEHALHAKEVLQGIVNELALYGPGKTPADLALRLDAAIAEAGLPPQPHRWVEAVALEASEGHVTVLDARFAQHDPQQAIRETEYGERREHGEGGVV